MEPFPFRRHSLRIVTFVSGLQFFDSLKIFLANRYLEGICLVWISNGTALVGGCRWRIVCAHAFGRHSAEARAIKNFLRISVPEFPPRSLFRNRETARVEDRSWNSPRLTCRPRNLVNDGVIFRACAIFDDLAAQAFSDTPACRVLYCHRVNETS